MDAFLCDELLQEIFQRLSPSSSSALSLVSKRWLHLYRTSTTSLSLRFTPHNSSIPSISSFLSHYPYLSSLSLLPNDTPTTASASASDSSTFSDHLLLAVASSCSNLHHLRFSAGPLSLFSLLSLSSSCSHLTSLNITLSRPLSFRWIVFFRSLKELSIFISNGNDVAEQLDSNDHRNVDTELPLESFCLSGLRAGDGGMGWLWKSLKKLRKLQLRSCEGIGDGPSFCSFIECLKDLQEVELRTCRSIVDGVLMKLAENCTSLNSLLVYDGGSREGLLRFISQCRCNLRSLDLRLPLDLDNDHLSAVAENLQGLSSLRLQSCCLVTGEGLKTLGNAMSCGLEELALINCDVVEREPGLLTTLGQNLRRLRKLDLSYNEMLVDKEFISMLVSCNYLIDLKLRGCRGLTNAAVVSMLKSCKRLESIDIVHCCGIEAEAVEFFVLNSPQLRRVQVEESKLSTVAKTWASHKLIEVVV